MHNFELENLTVRALKASYIPLGPHTRDVVLAPPIFEDVYSIKGWRAKRHVFQLSVLQYRYPLYQPSVAEHMAWSYYAFQKWRERSWRTLRARIGSIDRDAQLIYELSLAVMIHDIRKPPWTPLTETYQKQDHENLVNYEEIKTVCEKYGLDFKVIVDTVRGGPQSRYGSLLEGEFNFDQAGYVLQELRLAGSYGLRQSFEITLEELKEKVLAHPEEFAKLITFDEVLELFKGFGLVEEDGGRVKRLCLTDEEKYLWLFLRYKAAVVAAWRRFVSREKDVIIETLTQYLLRKLYERREMWERLQSLIDNPVATDFDFEEEILRATEESRDLLLNHLARSIVSGYIVHDYDVCTGPLPLGLLERVRSNPRELIKVVEEVEERLRERCRVRRDEVVAAAITIRAKPYFSLTWLPDPKHLQYEVRVQRRDGGLNYIQDVNEKIGELLNILRQWERMAYLHLVFPPGSCEIFKGKRHFYREMKREWREVLEILGIT